MLEQNKKSPTNRNLEGFSDSHVRILWPSKKGSLQNMAMGSGGDLKLLLRTRRQGGKWLKQSMF